jgi:hypothetical protein
VTPYSHSHPEESPPDRQRRAGFSKAGGEGPPDRFLLAPRLKIAMPKDEA